MQSPFSLSTENNTSKLQNYMPPYMTSGRLGLQAEKSEHFVDFDVSLAQAKAGNLSREKSFYADLRNAVELVNEKIIYSDDLAQQFITKPNSISVHDVIIAQQKADLHLSLTKNVLQRSVTAYQSLINLR